MKEKLHAASHAHAHAHHKRAHHRRQEPAAEPGSAKSVAEQVQELGKEMCKERPNDPKCEMFGEKVEELEEVLDEEEAAKAPPAGEAAEPGPPVEVKEQGYSGKKIAHADGETKVDDWAKEYPKDYAWSSYAIFFLSTALFLALLLAGCLYCKK